MPRRCKLSFIAAILRSAAQPSPAAYHFLYRTERCCGCSTVYVCVVLTKTGSVYHQAHSKPSISSIIIANTILIIPTDHFQV